MESVQIKEADQKSEVSSDKTAANPEIRVSNGHLPELADSQVSVTAYPDLRIKQDTPDDPPQLKKSASHIPTKSAKDVSQDFQLHRKSFDDASRAAAAAAVDTTAPVGSVKDAVSKFGGITNWKTHRVRSMERQKTIETELEKVQEEIPVVKKQSETAEESKNQILKELDSTKRLVEEFKLNLERAQKQEHQANQDSELAKLRVEELEQGIAGEASVADKKELEVAKGRHLMAVSDLENLKKELEKLREDYDSLMDDRHAAVRKAEKALSASKEVEMSVENLTVELMSTKESLESAHAAHLEAEELKTGAAKAQEQDVRNQQKELKQAEEELVKLNQKILAEKDVKSKLNAASALLQDLKAEFAAYMESKQNPETGEIARAIASAKKNLEEVKLSTEKANNEVNLLKAAATALKTNLESEKAVLETIKTVSETVGSMEAELERTKTEISLLQVREREAKEEMVELPKKLQKAAEEADEAKSLAKVANEELEKAKEEGNQSKARISTTEGRLLAAKKEIEATRAAERLALAAIEALQAPGNEDSPDVITLSLAEYYELNKRAHDAEARGNDRVTETLSLIEAAKESEVRSLEKLENLASELATKKEGLETARQKAEKAKEGKLSVEQELRKLKGEHEPQQKAEPAHDSNTDADASSEGKKKKKIKSIFPKIFMFMGKKKSHSHSKGH